MDECNRKVEIRKDSSISTRLSEIPTIDLLWLSRYSREVMPETMNKIGISQG